MADKTPYIKKFKELYERKNGKEISDSEALNLFESLVTLVNAIYKPIPKNHGK